jgi:hypothetical protein
MRFNAQTAQARAQIAALQSQMQSLNRQQALMNAASTRALSRGLANRVPASMDFNLRGPLGQMDDLTKRIQKGKITQKEFTETIRGTNKMYEYQNALQRASLNNIQRMGSQRMRTGINLPELQASSGWLRRNATEWATAGAAAKSYGRQVMDVGKNMAFMGRQAMLSVTAPIALIAAGAATAFYKVDQQLTNLQKVYGDTATGTTASASSIREAARGLSQEMNRQFGLAQKDTLELAQSFAALGESGDTLDRMVSSAGRLMRLGDVSTESATKMVSTLRTVFKTEGEELEKAVNIANAFENSTTLTMQDFSDALPKMGSIVQSWGGDVKQAAVILEGFTRSGIPAVEGANALKSGFTKLVRPTEKLEGKFADLTNGMSLTGIVKELDGDVPKILARIGEIQKSQNWDSYTKKNFAAELWGAYQLNRGMALTENLANPTDQMKQLMNKTDEELKTIADREVAVQMQSASAQFKQTLNDIQMYAEKFGEKILPMITKALKMIISFGKIIYEGTSYIIDALGPIGDMLSWIAPKALLMAAAFGPLMLMFSSFMLIKGGLITALGAMAALLGRMKGQKGQVLFQTGAQRAAALQNQQMVAQRDAETAATNRLTQAIQRLNSTYAGVRNAGTVAATNASRNANTQATAAQRVTTATNQQARAVSGLTAAQAQAARMGGRVLPPSQNKITQAAQANAQQAKRNNFNQNSPYGNNQQRVVPSPPRTIPPIMNTPAMAAVLRADSARAAQTAGNYYGNTFSDAARKSVRNNLGSQQMVSQGRNNPTNAGVASNETRNIRAGITPHEGGNGRVMSLANTNAARDAMAARQAQARMDAREAARNVRTMNPNGSASSQAAGVSQQSVRMAELAAHQENATRNQAAMNARFNEGAQRVGGMATGIGFVATLLSGTNVVVQKLAVGLMAVGTIAMVMPGLFAKIGVAAATAGRSVLALTGLTRVATGAAAGLGAAFSAALGPLVLLAAAGAIAYGVYRIMTNDAKKLHEENDKIKDSVEGWADVLGYTRKQFGQMKNESGEWVDTMATLQNNAENDEHLKPLIEKMKREAGNMSNLRIMLEQEAMKMYADGASADQVKQGIEVLLNASNIDPKISKELEIEFENITPTGLNGAKLSESVNDQITSILGSTENNTASYWQQQGFGSGILGTGFGGESQDTTALSQKAKTEIDAMYNQLNYAMANAEPGKGGAILRNYFTGIQNEINAGVATLPKAAQEAVAANGGTIMGLDIESIGGLSDEQIEKLKYQQTVVSDILARMKADAQNGDPNQAFFWDTAGGSMARFAQKNEAVIYDYQKGSDAFALAAHQMGDAFNNLSPEMKMMMMNAFRAASGLSDLSQAQVDAAMKAGDFGNHIKSSEKSVASAAAAMEEGAEDADDLNEAMGDGKTVDFTAKVNIEGVGEMSIDDLIQTKKDQMSGVRDAYMDEMAAEAQIQFDAQKRAFQDAQKAAQDALSARQDAEKEALNAAAEAEKKAFSEGWDSRIESEKKVYEDRIEAIENTQEAEDDLERMRKRNSDREARRLKYLQSLQQMGIDSNIAFAGGDLDEVARLSLNASTAANDFNTENTEAEAGYQKEDADRARSKAIDLIKEEEDAKMLSLEKQRKAEEEAMNLRLENQQKELAIRQKAEQDFLARKQEDDNIAYEISFQANQRALNRELEALRTQIPLNEAELQAHMQRVGAAYDGHGTNLMAKGNVWSTTIENSLIDHIDYARQQMSNDQAWMSYGNHVAEGIAQGGFKMNSDQFNNFLRTGEMPAASGGAPKGPAAPRTMGGVPGYNSSTRHAGGKLGSDRLDNRAGIPMNAPMRSNEVTVLAQKDEYMVRGKAHKKYGTHLLNRVNQGQAVIRHEGGAVDSGKTVARHEGGAIGTEMGAMGAAVMAAGMGAIIAKTALAAGTAMQNAQSAASSGGGGFDGQVVDLGGANGGYGLQRGANVNYGSGGFPQWVYTLAKSKGVQASTYPGHQEDDRREAGFAPNPGRLNRGIDWSGTVPAMQNFADYLMGIAPSTPTLEQVIWQNPNTGRKSGWAGRSDVSGSSYYASAYGGHQDHVHTRSNGPIQPGQGTVVGASPGGGGGSVPPSDAAKKFPQYAGWTTPGIQAYGAAQMAKFAPAYGSGDGIGGGAELGAIQTGNKEFYIKEIVDEAKRRGLDKNAAIIALMTAMQESSLLMYANAAVPESLSFPHDAVGSDHDSVGLFQQRQAGWGTLAQRMNARGSAGLFYNKLAGFNYNGLTKNDAAQKVQVSGVPYAYAKWEGAATEQANRYFDFGGIANGTGFMAKNTIRPERVLSPQNTQSFDKLIPMLGGLTDQGIVKYDVIADVLQRDAQLLLSGMKQSARETYNNLSEEQKQQINISLAGANITGVDDLERRLTAWADEIVKRIADEALAKQRRLGTR